MSKIAQTVVAHERRLLSFGGVVVRRVAMSESDQFRQYAEEALLWAAQSKTKEEAAPAGAGMHLDSSGSRKRDEG